MPDDREIARIALDMQSRAHDYPLVALPTYSAWSTQKLADGESPAFIAHLDAMAMWLLPEDVGTVGEEEFEELLSDVKRAAE